MVMRLIIAEKPSLAKNIISAIGNKQFQKKDGYYESSEYIVSWAFGHLFKLLDLEDYKPQDVREEKTSWALEGLPFCPSQFRFSLRRDAKSRAVDPGIRKQFDVLKQLCERQDVQCVIHAGDADREGEIIIRIILDQAKNKKPVMRLWMPDQTAETIQAELLSLKSDKVYDALANEGYARTYIDWLYGINLTRLATVKGGTLLRVGRVITPIVQAIYDRDMMIDRFQPETYLALKSSAETGGETIELTSKNTFPLSLRSHAEENASLYNRSGAVVSGLNKEEKILQPGKLYSLSKLQGVLGKRYGMSPKESLTVVQSLYEAGYVTYPRTNSEYLATAERGKINSILAKLKDQGYLVAPKDNKTSIYNDSKIESHSALTPTLKIAKQSDLKEAEWKVYSTILNRFLAVFCAEDCRVSRTTIDITVEHQETFHLTGDIILSRGFLQYDDTGKSNRVLPALSVGDRVNIDFKVIEKKTQPPKHYTVESLNNYLKNPFREEKQGREEMSDSDVLSEASDDAEYKAMLEGVELGTEATRTAIIETAIRSGYIELKRNAYHILPGGIHLIEALDKLQIHMGKEKTAELGRALKQVYRGELSIEDAVSKAYQEVNGYFEACANVTLARNSFPHGASADALGSCPKCGSDVLERKNLYGCSNRDCRFALWKDDKYFSSLGKKLTKTVVKNLLSKGQTSLKGCVSSKTGKTFDCVVSADFSGQYPKYSMRFPEKKPVKTSKKTQF